MGKNVAIVGEIIKSETGAAGPVLSDADFEDQIEDLAQDIQCLECAAIFRIAPLVAKAHDLFLNHRDEGGFRGWVERRLGYSRSHAYRLLDAAKWIKLNKSVSTWDTLGTLPVSAIYLLAAPSCPRQVSGQIVERLKAGEPVSLAEVKAAIVSAKQGVTGSAETLDTPETLEPDSATPKVDGAQSADDSAKQRQRDNERLFGEDPADRGDDHVGGGGDDDGHGGDHNDHNGDGPGRGEGRHRGSEDLFWEDLRATDADLLAMSLVDELSRNKAEQVAHEILQLPPGKDPNKPVEPETLVAHWQRCPTELRALLDAAGLEGVFAAMSPDFHIKLQLRTQPPVCLLQKLRRLDDAGIAQMLLEAVGAGRFEKIVEKGRAMRAPKGKSGKSGKKFNRST